MAVKKEESSVLMVMNLPDSLTEDHVRELLSPFGELKKFNLLKVSSSLPTKYLVHPTQGTSYSKEGETGRQSV